jgi:hypothetical protein
VTFNRYSPEDAYVLGSYPGDGAPWGWWAVINSTLQPALGLRWLLCYEENDRDICHLQKAAPKHWFGRGERIAVRRCPTRFGTIAWTTEATSDSSWHVAVETAASFSGEVHVHIHPPGGGPLRSASTGMVEGSVVVLQEAVLASGGRVELEVRA